MLEIFQNSSNVVSSQNNAYIKKNEKETCDNYQRLTLLHTKYKVYGRIINNRIQNNVETLLLENQERFRQGHSYVTMSLQ
jgi:hypothetical protein